MTSEEREAIESAGCRACQAQRAHSPDDWKNHPFRGHGYTKEQGFTHPQLKAEDAERREKEKRILKP
jgi:hypothetical protein